MMASMVKPISWLTAALLSVSGTCTPAAEDKSVDSFEALQTLYFPHLAETVAAFGLQPLSKSGDKGGEEVRCWFCIKETVILLRYCSEDGRDIGQQFVKKPNNKGKMEVRKMLMREELRKSIAGVKKWGQQPKMINWAPPLNFFFGVQIRDAEGNIYQRAMTDVKTEGHYLDIFDHLPEEVRQNVKMRSSPKGQGKK